MNCIEFDLRSRCECGLPRTIPPLSMSAPNTCAFGQKSRKARSEAPGFPDAPMVETTSGLLVPIPISSRRNQSRRPWRAQGARCAPWGLTVARTRDYSCADRGDFSRASRYQRYSRTCGSVQSAWKRQVVSAWLQSANRSAGTSAAPIGGHTCERLE